MISIEFLITSLVVVLIPGTGVLYTVSTGLFVGRRASLFAALGCTLGIIPSLLASITGLAIVIHTSALAFQVVKTIGVIYLLFLAWSMLKSSSQLNLENSQATQSTKHEVPRVVMKGFLINILNPKLSIFFLAFLPQFVPLGTEQPAAAMLTLGALLMAMTLIVFIAYGLLATSVRHHVIQSQKLAVWVQRVFAGSFAALGLRLAFANQE